MESLPHDLSLQMRRDHIIWAVLHTIRSYEPCFEQYTRMVKTVTSWIVSFLLVLAVLSFQIPLSFQAIKGVGRLSYLRLTPEINLPSEDIISPKNLECSHVLFVDLQLMIGIGDGASPHLGTYLCY